MNRVLILGGNHYFGKKLVSVLLKEGHSVTLLNRGNRDDGFGSKVKRIVCDRHNKVALEDAIQVSYDIVYDQCCFDYDQAKIACDVFNNRAKKYIFTSSISAYNQYGSSIKEELFDPLSFTFDKKETMDSNYGEAKRQAEVAFYKYAQIPVTAVRFPIVLDEYDVTDRLQFHVSRILKKEEIFFSNLESKMSFVSADDAAKALYQLGLSEYAGPINVASSKPISLKDCMGLIEKIVGDNLITSEKQSDENNSHYNISEDWFMNCSKLESLGIKLDEIEDYLPKMVTTIYKNLSP